MQKENNRPQKLTVRQSAVLSAKMVVLMAGLGVLLFWLGDWVFGPFVDSLGFPSGGPSSFAIKLVQPNWLGRPDLWPATETAARLMAVLHVGLAIGVYLWIRRMRRRNPN
jgi:hypothetical protein